MPGLKFTFGLGRYFNFSFDLQLGTSSEHGPAIHEASKSIVQDTSVVTNSLHVSSHPAADQIVPAEKPTSSIPTAVNPPSIDGRASDRVIDGYRHAPTVGVPHTSSSDGSVANLDRPLPRMPRLRKTYRIPITPRRKRRRRFSTSNTVEQSTVRSPAHIYTFPAASLPTKPSAEQSLPTPPESDRLGSPYRLSSSFQSLPVEIKDMIYRQLLVSSSTIKKPHRLVCSGRMVMVDSIQPIKDIDSTILRVCRSIYHEALPVLYGQNTFEFAKPRKLYEFGHRYLEMAVQRPLEPLFGFKESNAGRFTMIRSIILRLGHDRKPYVYRVPAAVPDRKRIWFYWHQYLFHDHEAIAAYDSVLYPHVRNDFPALDKVMLDFTAWQLSEADAIRTEPFICKLGRSGGLSRVVIKGVKNTTNLQQFRQGLTKPGGTFTVLD
ncbi:MAG: hypothetical protein Q9219_005459 [cf. Caloplaca sp. 3 TL-2023]